MTRYDCTIADGLDDCLRQTAAAKAAEANKSVKMSLASLPEDIVAKVTDFLLKECNGPMRIGDDEYHPRLLDVVRCLSTDKAAWALYESNPRFKALLFCAINQPELPYLGRPRLDPYLRSPDAWGCDRVIVLAVAKIEGTSLLCADSSFLDDREIVILALQNERAAKWEQRVYVHLPERLRADRDVVRAALGKGACFQLYVPTDKDLELFPPSIRDDKDLMLEIMRRADERRGFQYAPLNIASERLCGDREVVLAAVSQTGQFTFGDPVSVPNLQYASSALRDDRTVVEASVRATGGFGSLAFASERLRDDMELATLAVETYAPALEIYVDTGYEAMSARVRSNCGLFLEILAKVDDPTANFMFGGPPPSRAHNLLAKAAPALRSDESVLRAVAAAADLVKHEPFVPFDVGSDELYDSDESGPGEPYHSHGDDYVFETDGSRRWCLVS